MPHAHIPHSLSRHSPQPFPGATESAPHIDEQQCEALLNLCQQWRDDAQAQTPASSLAPDRIEPLYERGVSAYRNGDYQAARRDFAEVLLSEPLDARHHLAMGSAQQQLGDYPSALQFFLFATLLRADDPGVMFRIGECLIALDDPAGARAALEISQTLCALDSRYATLADKAGQLLATLP